MSPPQRPTQALWRGGGWENVPDGGKAILGCHVGYDGMAGAGSATVQPGMHAADGWGHGDGVAQTYLTFDGAEPTQVMMARVLTISRICRIASDKTG